MGTDAINSNIYQEKKERKTKMKGEKHWFDLFQNIMLVEILKMYWKGKSCIPVGQKLHWFG